MQSAQALRQQFPESPHWHISEDHTGFPLVHLTDSNAHATLSLYGAQVLSYRPTGQDDVLWLSEDACFREGKSIRGGIPICWPWFGPHPSDSTKPAHGIVRHRHWELVELSRQDAATCARFKFNTSENSDVSALNLELTVTVGKALSVQLTTTNSGAHDVTISSALHTYFAVSDIGDIAITGLEDKPFRDAVNNNRACLQRGPIRFNGELDRVYQQVERSICIHDPGLERVIHVQGQGSSSAVVWNPWIEKSERLGDMGNDGYRTMVCVETANADQDARTLKPGARHDLHARIHVQA